MKNKLKVMSFLLFSFFILQNNNIAQDYGVGLKVSTRGFGIDVLRSFGSQFNLRAGAAFFSISPDGGDNSDDFKYSTNLNLSSVVLLGDYYPFNNSIRITAGGIINLNSADIDLIPTKSYSVGGDVYDPESLGSLSAAVDFNTFAPYIGLGLGNPLFGESSLQFTFDVGTMYQGGAGVDLSATGLLEPSAAPDQEDQLEQNLSWFKWYPVVSFGVFYKF